MRLLSKKTRGAIRVLGILIVLLLFIFGCTSAQHLDRRLNSMAKPYRFSILKWDLHNLLHGPKPLVAAKGQARGETEAVLEYFTLAAEKQSLETEMNNTVAGEQSTNSADYRQELDRLEQEKKQLKDTVELVIGSQIRETLAKEDIHCPADRYARLNVIFPPIDFRLDQPPNLLIVSPRDRIDSSRRIMLVQDISLEAVEELEASIDSLGVSSLVVRLGGFGGAYPTFVADEASLKFTVEAATEEWLHQYLTFTPLGFMYVLDLTRVLPNYDLITMNETVAGIVSQEIGQAVLEAYYPQYAAKVYGREASHAESEFDREMRKTRIAVDQLLADRRIEQAERFMEKRRRYLASRGYYIRKLNQAYFAFYGGYGDDPVSVSPISTEIRELRSRSTSLSDFLRRAAAMTSHQDLVDSLKADPPE